jgi:hypothetical protein
MLQIQESFVNATEGYRYGDSDWQEPYTDDLGEIYRNARREYGRCTSRVYVDVAGGPPRAIGWVFTKRVEYDDAHRISDKAKRAYLREVWVTFRYVKPCPEAVAPGLCLEARP